MDGDLYRRVAELERAVKVLLDLNSAARAQLLPRDGIASCDSTVVQGPRQLVIPPDGGEMRTTDLSSEVKNFSLGMKDEGSLTLEIMLDGTNRITWTTKSSDAS